MNKAKKMRLFILLIISVFISSCISSNKGKKEKEATQLSSMEYLFDLSLHTKLFLQELDTELASSDKQEFIPSEKFIEKYTIRKIEDIYSISGFVKVNNEFKEGDLLPLNIKTGSQAGEIMTVIIPLNKMDEFLEISGIKYFEINKKVIPKPNRQ